MPKWLSIALLLAVATVLGATVLREPIASAAQLVDAKIVAPLDGDGNVTVHEQGTAAVEVQNLDRQGDIKVHEQGTASVDVTNSSLAVQQAGTPSTFDICAGEDYFVPFGKRLVIQYVAGHYSDENIHMEVLVTGSGEFRLIGQPIGGNSRWIDEQVAIYAGSGELVTIVNNGCATFSGYLVDV